MSGDQLLRGAALNAVLIAEAVINGDGGAAAAAGAAARKKDGRRRVVAALSAFGLVAGAVAALR